MEAVLHVTQSDIEQRAGLGGGTLSNAMHDRYRTDPRTVEKLWQTVQDIAKERDVVFLPIIEAGFYNAIGVATRVQHDASSVMLRIFRARHGLEPDYSIPSDADLFDVTLETYGYRIKELEEELQRKEARIVQLEEELKRRS